jgi:hypothetical protein
MEKEIADARVHDCISCSQRAGRLGLIRNGYRPQCCNPSAPKNYNELSSEKQTIMLIESTSVNNNVYA